MSALLRDPASINTLRVSINGQEVSLLTTAIILGEDTATIESLLAQGADIKAADQEGAGILHALVDNTRLSDRQKEELIEHFFENVDSDDDINTNRDRMGGNSWYSASFPWQSALKNGNQRTALKIVNKMSIEQANKDGLYYAARGIVNAPVC